MGRRTNTAVWEEKYSRWKINVQKDGKRRSFYSSKPGRTGQREANKKADEWLDQGVESRRKTVDDVWPEFLKQKQLTTSEDNWRPMVGRYNKWIGPRIGRKRLESLTDRDLQDVLDAAQAAGKSKKTIKNIRADMMGMMKFARKAKYTAYIPEDVEVPAGARYKGKNILQPNELAILMCSDMTTWRFKPTHDQWIHFYRLAVLTGMRPGELLGLRWSDVDLKRKEVHLHGSQTIYKKRTLGKNENALRTVPLSSLAVQEFEAQRTLTGNREQIFPDHDTQFFRRHWNTYCDYNGIQRCTLYELRHTFVSLAQSLPEGQLKAMVGHSKSMDTYGIYAHHVDGQEGQISAALDKLFSNVGGS